MSQNFAKTGTNIKLTITLDYNVSDDLLYQGEASVGSTKSDPVWNIKKFVYNIDGDLTDVQWANGSIEFENIWDDRASLSYY